MKTARLLYHLARADVLERVRRTSFLFAVAVGVFLGYSVNAGQLSVALGDYRGVYNSAWVGSMLAIIVNTIFSLAGFYIVKNAIQRDIETGVGQIMATTPLTRGQYVIGKWLSNLVVLSALVGVLALAGLVLQISQPEVPGIDLLALLTPIVVLTLPVMGLVAALAVLFESINWLRGGFGNVVYFFVWSFLLTSAIIPAMSPQAAVPDPLGVGLLYRSMNVAAHQAYPDFTGEDFSIGSNGIDPRLMQTFVWNGIDWTPGVIAGQMAYLLVALGLVLLAALFFGRFDPARVGGRRAQRAKGPPALEAAAPAAAPSAPTKTAAVLSPVRLGGFRLGAVWLAELKLLLKGQQWWWFVVATGLIVAGLASGAAARQYVLTFAWIWPVLIWSQLGNREAAHHAGQMVFSAPRAVWRQLPAAWLAGVTLAALTGSGVLVTLLVTGDGYGLAAWVTGALFVPALALGLGVLSGSGKLFEISYLIIWYIGPLNHTAALDYTGATGQSQPAAFLVATVVLLVVALVVRRWQVQGR